MSIHCELKNISKSFGPVLANQNVYLNIQPGTIHALVGENGAGKSTAMKILFGLVQPDSGQIFYNEKLCHPWSPIAAFKQGIGMVHQHFMLAETEMVLDNLVLGVEKSTFGLRKRKQEKQNLQKLMQDTGLDVPLEKFIRELPLGMQSRCEILKVLYRNAQFLILDEPTAVLTPQEVEKFLNTLRTLRKQGKTMLLVTHKLKEVLAIADEVTVLRAGKTVGVRKTAETSIEELSELMVGRRLKLPRVTPQTDIQSKALLKLEELELHSGEITGIAGIEGHGQENLIQKVLPFTQALIPANRQEEGLILSFNLTENLRLKRNLVKQKGVFSYFGKTTLDEKSLLKTYDIRPPEPKLLAHALSGGNQQKLIIARELSQLNHQSVVLAIHPTRGVDLGAIEFIHKQLLEIAKNGAAVLLISSELDELMNLSHKIGALYKGQIIKWFVGPPYDEFQIGHHMLCGATTGAGT